LGVAVGLPVALALASLVRGFLFGVEPADPVTFGGVTVVLLAIAVTASWVPARAAARTDPSVVLKD
jgi:ABC-type lipoprotein release transport system permease subunit